jgi:hypothetical protein
VIQILRWTFILVRWSNALKYLLRLVLIGVNDILSGWSTFWRNRLAFIHASGMSVNHSQTEKAVRYVEVREMTSSREITSSNEVNNWSLWNDWRLYRRLGEWQILLTNAKVLSLILNSIASLKSAKSNTTADKRRLPSNFWILFHNWLGSDQGRIVKLSKLTEF